MAMEPETALGTALASSGGRSALSVRALVPLLMLFAMVSHINRIGISTAGTARIMDQYGISPTRMGWVYLAFLLTYTLGMIPGGLLIDRIGPRGALMTVGFGSAAFGALTGLVGLSFHGAGPVFLALLAVRGLMGMFSAPLHPSMARAVGQWVSSRSGSRINGLVNGSALLGIAATPVFFGALIDRFDWPYAFFFMALVTTLLTLAWSLLIAAPSAGPARGESYEASDEPSGVSWWSLLRHRSLMMLTLSYGTVGYFQYLFFYWMNYYFQDVMKLPESTSRFYAAIPALAMAVGMPLGGWLADRLEHARGSSSTRGVVPTAGMLAGALLLIAGILTHDPVWMVACFALAMGGVGMAEGPFWSTAVALGGRRGGSAAALLNTGGNAGGMLAPVLTPWIGETYGWGPAVCLGSAICLVGVVLWCWIDPEERLS
jgi:MFS family permease